MIPYHLDTKHKEFENIKLQGFCEGHIFNKVPWTIVAMPQKDIQQECIITFHPSCM
jgi:hypothetical protein